MANKTPRLGLNIPNYTEHHWDVPVNENWDILDAACGKLVGGLKTLVTSADIVGVTDYLLHDDTAPTDWAHDHHASWYNEPLGTHTRGTKKEFPTHVKIVATKTEVYIFDATLKDMPMWMKFISDAGAYIHASATPIKAVAMNNGKLVVGGLAIIDFTTDSSIASLVTDTESARVNLPISGRNNTDVSHKVAGPAWLRLPNAVVNDVDVNHEAVAVGTDGGVSIIRSSTVSNMTGPTTATAAKLVKLHGPGLYFTLDKSNIKSRYIRYHKTLPIADIQVTTSGGFVKNSDALYSQSYISPTNISATHADLAFLSDGISHGANCMESHRVGTPSGLTFLAPDDAAPETGMVCYLNADYITGWLAGNIKGAWLANDKITGRSIDKKDLTETGAITEAQATPGSDLMAYSGFSAANYLEVIDAVFADTQFIYGWQKSASGAWEFKHGLTGASVDGVTISGTTVKIEGTLDKALVRVSATTPTPTQLAKIEADEKPLFNPNAKFKLPVSSVNDISGNFIATDSGMVELSGFTVKNLISSSKTNLVSSIGGSYTVATDTEAAGFLKTINIREALAALGIS